MIKITESGVTFGTFSADDCYQIEHSQGHKALGESFKMVEFTYLNGQKLFVVEAKSSIPSSKKSPEEYTGFWRDIFEKFENALLLQLMGCLQRNPAAALELPQSLRSINWAQTQLHLRLVIPKAPDEFLSSLTDKFRKVLHKLKVQWCIDDLHIFVLNEQKARREGLLAS